MSYFSEEELKEIGFMYVGKNVKLSRKSSIYNSQKISIGDNSRIDDFCVLSTGDGGILIGKNVHIAVYSSLIGREAIVIKDYANISSRVSIYSSNDDYSGEYMTNPTVSEEFTNVTHGLVQIGKHVIVGSGTVILPNSTLEDGVCIGALSLVNTNCKAFNMYAGVPIRYLKKRSQMLLKLEQKNEN